MTGICPYQVYDAGGALVFSPSCYAIAILVPPGATFSTQWEQIDDRDLQVAPGLYRVDVLVPNGGIVQHDVVIDASVEAAVTMVGVPRIGTTRNLALGAPGYGDEIYLMAASGSNTVGFPTCGGTLPLDPGPIFDISLISGGGAFMDFLGVLEPDHTSQMPALAIPDDPVFQGLELFLAFAIIDLQHPCPVSAISEPYSLIIQ